MQTDVKVLANNTQQCSAQHVASVCMGPQCWHRENVCARLLQSIVRITVLERIASLDDHQRCWQYVVAFVCMCITQQVPTAPNIVGLTLW